MRTSVALASWMIIVQIVLSFLRLLLRIIIVEGKSQNRSYLLLLFWVMKPDWQEEEEERANGEIML